MLKGAASEAAAVDVYLFPVFTTGWGLGSALSTRWDGYNCVFIYLLVVLTSLSLSLILFLWTSFVTGFISLLSFLKSYLSCVRVPSAVSVPSVFD